MFRLKWKQWRKSRSRGKVTWLAVTALRYLPSSQNVLWNFFIFENYRPTNLPLMQIIETIGAQPRTALASRTISLDLIQNFLVVRHSELRLRFDALHAVAAQTLSLQVTQGVTVADLLEDFDFVWQRLSVEGADGCGVWWHNEDFGICWEKRRKSLLVEVSRKIKWLSKKVKRMKRENFGFFFYFSFSLWLCSSFVTTSFFPTVFSVALHFDFRYSRHR